MRDIQYELAEVGRKLDDLAAAASWGPPSEGAPPQSWSRFTELIDLTRDLARTVMAMDQVWRGVVLIPRIPTSSHPDIEDANRRVDESKLRSGDPHRLVIYDPAAGTIIPVGPDLTDRERRYISFFLGAADLAPGDMPSEYDLDTAEFEALIAKLDPDGKVPKSGGDMGRGSREQSFAGDRPAAQLLTGREVEHLIWAVEANVEAPELDPPLDQAEAARLVVKLMAGAVVVPAPGEVALRMTDRQRAYIAATLNYAGMGDGRFNDPDTDEPQPPLTVDEYDAIMWLLQRKDPK